MYSTKVAAGPFVKGALSYLSPRFRNPHMAIGTASADFAYSQFLRFITLTAPVAGWNQFPKIVAEVGPGSSFGFGIGALLAGASRYYALDLIDQTSSAGNLRILDDLVKLFRARAPLPSTGFNARIFPFLERFEFPEHLMPNLDDMLSDERVAAIRANLMPGGPRDMIRAYAPWTHFEQVVDDLPNWIVSNSVLEHVEDLESAYRAFGRWSSPGTVMSHVIDYSSHRITPIWNGHWAVPDAAWRITRGKRYYLINRVPHGEHLRRHEESGFRLLAQEKLRRVDGFLRDQFVPPFGAISAADAGTHLAFVVSRYE